MSVKNAQVTGEFPIRPKPFVAQKRVRVSPALVGGPRDVPSSFIIIRFDRFSLMPYPPRSFMKVLVCDPVSPKGIGLLQQRPEFEVKVLDKRLSEAELLPVVKDVVAMVVRSETKVTRKVIEAA